MVGEKEAASSQPVHYYTQSFYLAWVKTIYDTWWSESSSGSFRRHLGNKHLKVILTAIILDMKYQLLKEK